MTDWPALVGLWIASRSAIYELDDGLIYPYALPRLGATPASLQAAEARLGRRLPSGLYSLLVTADGIRGIEGTDDLYGTSDLGQSSRWRRQQAELERLQRLSKSVPEGPTALVIGGSDTEPSLLVGGNGDDDRPVTWIYDGAVADVWSDLELFLEGATALNYLSADGLRPGGNQWQLLQDLRLERTRRGGA